MTGTAGHRPLLVVSVAVSFILSQGCVSFRTPRFMAEPSAREWPATLSLAETRAANGRIQSADSLLAAFAGRYPGTAEGNESLFWRALFELDPTNHVATSASALALLDSYISNAPTGAHRTEAVTLRRITGRVDGLTRLAASAMTTAQDASTAAANANARAAEVKTDLSSKPADAAAQDAEIKRLRDELAKANAELERIRRRLAQPPT